MRPSRIRDLTGRPTQKAPINQVTVHEGPMWRGDKRTWIDSVHTESSICPLLRSLHCWMMANNLKRGWERMYGVRSIRTPYIERTPADCQQEAWQMDGIKKGSEDLQDVTPYYYYCNAYWPDRDRRSPASRRSVRTRLGGSA